MANNDTKICPYCAETDNKVIDSRLSKDGNVIRRRRECLVCSRRFTTYEHIEEIPIMIVKKDGRREIFNRDKYTCQYCGHQSRSLTLDHVVPRYREGQHTWENIVSACNQCK